MKKFIMVTPLQPCGEKDGFDCRGKCNLCGIDCHHYPTDYMPNRVKYDMLSKAVYTPVGNSKLLYDKFDRKTRFPIIPVINAYANAGEEIRVIAVNTHTPASEIHFLQLEEEVSALAAVKGFICNGVTDVPVDYAGDVGTMVDIFRKLLDHIEDDDILYACFTYGVKPMPIAELMALQYAYRIKKNVSIGCLVYGEMDHSIEPQQLRIFDITALIHLDEIIRLLSEQGVKNPLPIIDSIISVAYDANEDEDDEQ